MIGLNQVDRKIGAAVKVGRKILYVGNRVSVRDSAVVTTWSPVTGAFLGTMWSGED